MQSKMNSGRPPTGGPLASGATPGGAPHRKSQTAGRPPTPARRAHLIDRAVEWARRIDRGESQAEIRRSIPARSRPSRGYISIVARLGHALKDLPPLEFELYRSPRVTLRLAQKIVRADVDTLAIRLGLRQAITALPHPADRRRGRRGHRADTHERASVAVSGSRSRSATDPDLFAWRWDGAQAEEDPVGYIEEYIEFVEGLHGEMIRRTRALVARRAAPPILIAGQSLARLAASVAAYRRVQLDAAGAPPAEGSHGVPPGAGGRPLPERQALERLEHIGQALEQLKGLDERDDRL